MTSEEFVLARRLFIMTFVLLVSTAAHGAVKISSDPTQNMGCTDGVCTPTAKNAVLNVDDLANMLASSDVKIASGSLAQDIDVDTALSWTSTKRLTLDAYHSIAFNKPLEVIGAGALTITTNDGLKGGDFRFFEKGHVKFLDKNSSLVINGQNYLLVKSIGQIKRSTNHGRAPNLALSKSIDASKHGTYFGTPVPNETGIFEGLGNTIANLTIIDGTSRGNVGLFVEAGEVRDLGIVNANITGTGSEQKVGAIAGEVDGIILNSFVTGQVSATGPKSSAGGIAAGNNGTIARSHSDASVSVAAGGYVAGGLVGANEGSVVHDYDGIVEESYSTGTVVGGDGVATGGLIGWNWGGVISNSYATSAVVGGNNSFAGGLAGENTNSDSSSPKITASYSTGTITGGSGAMVGGLIGEDLAQSGTTNSYWDLDTSGISDPGHGAGNVQNDPGITGLTDAQFKSGLPSGFSPSIWKEKTNINTGYPYLIDLPPK